MDKRNCLNLCCTLVVLAVTAAAWFFLPGGNAKQTQLSVASLPTQNPSPQIKYLACDESTGVLTREQHFDADELLRETHVKFKDGTNCIVSYNALGRINKVVEIAANKEFQEFSFHKKSGVLLAGKAFRADNSLKKETKLADKGVIESTVYAADGKSRLCLHRQQENKDLDVKTFYDDGKTVKAHYKETRQTEAELKTYAPDGTLSTWSTSHLELAFHDENNLQACHECSSEDTHRIGYRNDGETVWYSAHAKVEAGGVSAENTITEYHADGTTPQHVVKVLVPFADSKQPDLETWFMDIHDKAGILIKQRFFRADNSVVCDKFFAADGSVLNVLNYSDHANKDSAAEGLLALCKGLTSAGEVSEHIFREQDPNHLSQAIAPE